jgi:hypothetical protein
LREEYTLRVSENSVLRIFEPERKKDCAENVNDKLHILQ